MGPWGSSSNSHDKSSLPLGEEASPGNWQLEQVAALQLKKLWAEAHSQDSSASEEEIEMAVSWLRGDDVDGEKP